MSEYRNFVHTLASKETRFRSLNAFLSTPCRTKAKIHVVTFPSNERPIITEIEEHLLESHLVSPSSNKLYIVENLSQNATSLFGQYCNIDAQFFLDYLDIVVPTPSYVSDNEGTWKPGCVRPRGWFRLGEVEDHIPALQSVQRTSDYTVIRFIGSREYHTDDGKFEKGPVSITERLEPTNTINNFERIAGGHNPIAFRNENLWPVAMTRHSAAIWFDKGNAWKTGIVLIDPPFQFAQAELQRQNSKYRCFSSVSSPSIGRTLSSDYRTTYATSFLHHLLRNPPLHTSAGNLPSPLSITQDLYRMIASEWILVNTYLERDLNAIEWRLERFSPRPPVDTLDTFLDKLFMMRRRSRKYASLVMPHTHLQRQLPSSWFAPPSTHDSDSVARDIEDDFQQVLDLIRRNDERITQTVALITSLMSVIEGKRATSLNQRLTFLTVVATVALPFNVLGAILGMETKFAPGAESSWVLWTTAAVCIFVLLSFWILLLREPWVKKTKAH